MIGFWKWLELACWHDARMLMLVANMSALLFAAFMLFLYVGVVLLPLPLGIGGAFLLALCRRWKQDVKNNVWYLQEAVEE